MSDKTDGQHEARLDALEQSRRENREVLGQIFRRLDTIAADLAAMQATMKERPNCPDPGACLKLEAALSDQNRRLMAIELARQKTLGEISGIGLACTAVGGLIGWALELWHINHK